MKYANDSVRRQDRLLDEASAIELLRKGEYGVLSMVESLGDELGGYGIPINYVWNGGNIIYFHCAPEGHKLKSIAARRQVSLCVIGTTNVISHKFTTAYESIIVRGTARADLPTEERHQALELFLDKYAPADKAVGLKYAEKSFSRTNIIRLDISSISGKCKRVLP